MTRDEFKQMAIELYPEWANMILDDGEPLWIPEVQYKWKARYFAETNLTPYNEPDRLNFWKWNNEYLSLPPLCYMSDTDNNVEWWGFNTEEDMTWFLMRWNK